MKKKCTEFNIDNCIFSSIYFDSIKRDCRNMCSDSTKYAIINYYIDKEYTINAINTNDEISIIKEQEIKDLYKIFSSNFFNYQKDDIFKSIKSNAYMCIGNLGTGDLLLGCKKGIEKKKEIIGRLGEGMKLAALTFYTLNKNV